MFPKKDLWVCLSCPSGVELRCGRGADSACAIEHAKESKHGLVMNVLSRMIWCYFCDTEVLDEYGHRQGTLPQKVRHCLDPADPTTDPEEEQTTRPTRPRRQSSNAPAPDADESESSDDEDSFTWLDYYRNARGGEVGMSNLGNTCMPEADTRVLTDAGFLFVGEVEARLRRKEEVRYAAYQPATQSLVYCPGRLVFSAPPKRWVEFTQADSRHLWSESSHAGAPTETTEGEGGQSSHLSLRTTPNHRMYVQPCRQDGPAAPRVLPAEELTVGFACCCTARGVDCAHGCSSYRFLAGATRGVDADPTSGDWTVDSPAAAFGLQSSDEVAAFLELYGFWLGEGSLSRHSDGEGSEDAVVWRVRSPRDRSYLLSLLERLRLRAGEKWQWRESGHSLHLLITHPGWLSCFSAEYGSSSLAERRLWSWALQRLSQEQLRALLFGLRQADCCSSSSQSSAKASITVSSIALREQLLQLCIHAGYSAYYTASSSTDEWQLHFSDSVTCPLPSANIRFDQPYNAQRDGRVWCVEVQHPDHLIIVQRAAVGPAGAVTQVSRAVVAGNCFMNSALQALAHTPPIIAFLSEMSHIPLDSIKQRLIADFSVLLQKVWSGHYSLVAPGDLLRDVIFINPFFRGYGQHDAQELIRCLIDQMHEGLKRCEEYEYTRYVYGEGSGEEQEVRWRERELLKERERLIEKVRERRGKKGDKDRKRRDRDHPMNGHSTRHSTTPSITPSPSSPSTPTEQKDPVSSTLNSPPSSSSTSTSGPSPAPASTTPSPPTAAADAVKRPIKIWFARIHTQTRRHTPPHTTPPAARLVCVELIPGPDPPTIQCPSHATIRRILAAVLAVQEEGEAAQLR